MIKQICFSLLHLLGIVFVVSAILKSVNIFAFASEIGEYLHFYISNWTVKFRIPIAILVCTIEMAMGLLSFKKELACLTGLAFFVLSILFLYLTGYNYLFPPLGGGVESCGCFGEFIHLG